MKKIKKEYFIAALFLCLFLVLTILVKKGKMDHIDEVIFNFIIGFKSSGMTTFMDVVSTIASTKGVIAIALVLTIILAIKKELKPIIFILFGTGLGAGSMKVIKEIIKRPRPEWRWTPESGYSFPSGHTISSYMLYGVISLLLLNKVNKKWKYPLVVFLMIFVVLIGISRIYLGVHYFSDVLGSILLGSAYLSIFNVFISADSNNDKDKTKKAIQTK